MHFKLAILTALARGPDGRATLDELRRDVEVLTANEDHVRQSSRRLAISTSFNPVWWSRKVKA